MTAENVLADERELIKAAQVDPRMFDGIYRENLARVFSYVLSRCRSRPVAEDITSEVFVRALRALPRFEWRGVPYRAYLLRIADNLLRDTASRAVTEARTTTDGQAESQMPAFELPHDDALLHLVERLPDDQRLVLELRFAEDRSVAQVAQELGRTEGAVKQLQHRAISTLRAWLTAREEPHHD